MDMEIFIIIGFVVLVMGIIAVALYLKSQQVQRLKDFAVSRGLIFQGGFMGPQSLAGSWNGVPLAVRWWSETHHTGYGKNRSSHTTSYTDVTATAKGRLPQAKLTPEDLLSTFGKLVGMKDIKTGDEEFDRKYSIVGSDDNAVKAVFADPSIRSAVRESKFHSLDINGSTIMLRVRKEVIDTAALERLLNSVAAIARAAK